MILFPTNISCTKHVLRFFPLPALTLMSIRKEDVVLLLRQKINIWGIGLSVCAYGIFCVYTHTRVQVYNFQLRGTRQDVVLLCVRPLLALELLLP